MMSPTKHFHHNNLLYCVDLLLAYTYIETHHVM